MYLEKFLLNYMGDSHFVCMCICSTGDSDMFPFLDTHFHRCRVVVCFSFFLSVMKSYHKLFVWRVDCIFINAPSFKMTEF